MSSLLEMFGGTATPERVVPLKRETDPEKIYEGILGRYLGTQIHLLDALIICAFRKLYHEHRAKAFNNRFNCRMTPQEIGQSFPTAEVEFCTALSESLERNADKGLRVQMSSAWNQIPNSLHSDHRILIESLAILNLRLPGGKRLQLLTRFDLLQALAVDLGPERDFKFTADDGMRRTPQSPLTTRDTSVKVFDLKTHLPDPRSFTTRLQMFCMQLTASALNKHFPVGLPPRRWHQYRIVSQPSYLEFRFTASIHTKLKYILGVLI
jgi:hypothetical protein